VGEEEASDGTTERKGGSLLLTGALVDSALVWGRDALAYVGIGLLTTLPWFVLDLLQSPVLALLGGHAEPSSLLLPIVLFQLVSLGLNAAVLCALRGAVTVAVFRALDGTRPTVRSSLSSIAPRIGTLVAVGFLVLPLGIVATLATWLLPDATPSWISRVVFVLELAVLDVSLCIALPAVVMERQGPVRSLTRGWRLASGHRLGLFVTLALGRGLQVVVSQQIQEFLGATLLGDLLVVHVPSQFLWYAVSNTFVAVFAAVCYRAFLPRDSESLAEAFD